MNYLVHWKRFTAENNIEEGGGFREYKENSNQVQRKTWYRSKETREVGFDRGKRLQERRITRKVHDENVV